MVTSLLDHELIETTDAKAKEVRRVADRMITLGKRGSLHARRQAAAVIRDDAIVAKLFGGLAARYEKRPGGYTRVLKSRVRVGDAAPLSIVELVRAYAEQETLGRIKGAGRWLAYGAVGALLLGIGLSLVLLGLLRLLQTELDTTLDGAWSWVPYAIVTAVAVLVLLLALSRVKKATLAKEPS